MSLVPSEILNYEIWRLISSPFFHTSFIHLAFNLIMIIQVCPYIEKHIGTYWFWIHLFLFCILSGFYYSGFVILLSLMNLFDLYYIPLLGFSSVILSFSSLNANLSQKSELYLFKFIKIKPKYVPYVLFLFYLAILPNPSVLSLVFGIFSGYSHFFFAEKKLQRLWRSSSNKQSKQNKGERIIRSIDEQYMYQQKQ